MLKIAHIINPVTVDESSDLYAAQPIPFETMRTAREMARGKVDITFYSAQYPEDIGMVSNDFKPTKDLNRSILDLGEFKVKRKLPLLKDILDRVYESADADFLIYTNLDIALMPHFYLAVNRMIEQGYDAFVINRRTIPPHYKTIAEIPLMYAEIGEKHKGRDCFIFKRDMYPNFKLGNCCTGIIWNGRILLWNLIMYAKKFIELKGSHLTFHIGNDRIWKDEKYADYSNFNKNEAYKILDQMKEEFGTLEKLAKDNYLKGFHVETKPAEPIAAGSQPRVDRHKFLFTAGLHKSGTSILARILRDHPFISGFENTGFPQDEGQFLQSVFPTAITFGGPGIFGFNSAMHLTENSSLVTEANRQKLFSEWSPYWDLSKPILLEKSPPNLLKTRFLQTIFPHSYFVVTIRHPGVVSLATQKWIPIQPRILLRHWLQCYNIFFTDKNHLENCLIIRYEDFVREPDPHLKRIYDFIGIEGYAHAHEIRQEVDKQYFEKWQGIMAEWKNSPGKFMKTELVKIEEEVNQLGYSLFSLEI